MKITIIRNKNDMIIYKVDYNNINRKTKYVDINEFYLSEYNIRYILKSDSNNKLKEYIIRNYKKNKKKKKDNSMRNIIFLAIGLMIVAIFFPIILGLISIGVSENTSTELVNPSIITLLTVLIPIIAIIGLVLFFFQKK